MSSKAMFYCLVLNNYEGIDFNNIILSADYLF